MAYLLWYVRDTRHMKRSIAILIACVVEILGRCSKILEWLLGGQTSSFSSSRCFCLDCCLAGKGLPVFSF